MKFPLKEIVTDFEVGISRLTISEKEKLREDVKPVLLSQREFPERPPVDIYKTVKDLKQKDVFYTKADKGNALVILDRSDYDNRLLKLIADGPYKRVRNPLTSMVNATNDIINRYEDLFGKKWRWNMKVSNPMVPKIYGLPKIHKPGNTIRPIVSNISSPCYKLAKWVIQKFTELQLHGDSFTVKNSTELVQRIKDIEVEEDELLCSFDIQSYFTNVPVDESLQEIEDLLDQKTGINHLEKSAYLDILEICVLSSYFQFRDKFYRQNDGTAMGNPTSPFVADSYVQKLEKKLKTEYWFPRVWCRYVDDVFAVVKKEHINIVLEKLNSISRHIKFTLEIEKDNKLPFLDLEISKEDGRLSFDIYRKNTTVERFITSDSYHHPSHKYASLNSMVHRLCNTPLSAENHQKELSYIKHLADVNGFDHSIVDNILRRHKYKAEKRNATTLRPLEEKKTMFVYHLYIVQRYNKIWKEF